MQASSTSMYRLSNELGWTLKLKYSDEGLKHKVRNKAGLRFKETIKFAYDGFKIHASLKDKLKESSLAQSNKFRVYKCHEKIYVFFGKLSKREETIVQRDPGIGTEQTEAQSWGVILTLGGIALAGTAPLWLGSAMAIAGCAVVGSAITGAGVELFRYGCNTREENYCCDDFLKHGGIGLMKGGAGGVFAVGGGLAAGLVPAAGSTIQMASHALSGIASEFTEKALTGEKMTINDLQVLFLSGALGASVGIMAGAASKSAGSALKNVAAIDKFATNQRVLLSTMKGGFVGATQAGTSTVIQNALEERKLTNNLASSMVMGGTFGAISSGISEAVNQSLETKKIAERSQLEDEVIERVLSKQEINENGREVPIEEKAESIKKIRNFLKENCSDEDLRNILARDSQDSTPSKTDSKNPDSQDNPKTTSETSASAENTEQTFAKQKESVVQRIKQGVATKYKSKLQGFARKHYKFYTQENPNTPISIDQAIDEISRGRQVTCQKRGYNKDIVDSRDLQYFRNLNNALEIPRLQHDLKHSLAYIDTYINDEMMQHGGLSSEAKSHANSHIENAERIHYDITDRQFAQAVDNAVGDNKTYYDSSGNKLKTGLEMMKALNKGSNIYDKKGNIIINVDAHPNDLNATQFHQEMSNQKQKVAYAPMPSQTSAPQIKTPDSKETGLSKLKNKWGEKPTPIKEEHPVPPHFTPIVNGITSPEFLSPMEGQKIDTVPNLPKSHPAINNPFHELKRRLAQTQIALENCDNKARKRRLKKREKDIENRLNQLKLQHNSDDSLLVSEE